MPAGRPFLLAELRTKMASIGDAVTGLWSDSHPAEYDDVADELYAVFRTAANLAPPKSHTGCRTHPDGAVDPEAPQGWTRCLLCNEARRRGMHPADVPPPARTNPLGYPIPDGPYDLELLRQLLSHANSLSFSLSLRSEFSEFEEMADVLHQAFCVARELSRPRNTSGCNIHPGAPTDPTANGACLFCVGAARRRADEKAGVPLLIPRRPAGLKRRVRTGPARETS
ncbi:hypothetical protein [Kitasatospora fiedleri]|uniref:hypothetical protein n=1 Tax=Kitasatospora fiedleri TaxID=2991545 RepID=UPI00249BD0E5|nr:hypothetical protein [Kitasatospora fiedleri]